MKLNKIGVLVSNKKGDVFQIALTLYEMEVVKNLLIQLHRGKIKVLDKKLESVEIKEYDKQN